MDEDSRTKIYALKKMTMKFCGQIFADEVPTVFDNYFSVRCGDENIMTKF